MPELPRTLLQWLNVLFLLAGGVVLLVAVAWWRVADSRDPLRKSPLRPNRLTGIQVWLCLLANVFGGWIGIALADWIAPEGLTEVGHEAWRGLLGSNAGQILVIVTCLVVARQAFRGGWRTFGLGRYPFRTEIGYAVAAWLVAMFVTALVAVVTTLAIEWLWPRFKPPDHAVFQAMEDPAAPGWMRVLAFTGALILAPIGEELLFRGIIQTGIRKLLPRRRGSRYQLWVAILLTAMFFGAMHFGTPHHVPALVALGVLLGFLYEWRGSLTLPIIVHMLFNGRTLLWYELQRNAGAG